MKKRALIIVGIVAAAAVLFGLYLVYLNVFVDQHRLDLRHKTVSSQEYRNDAADNSIIPSYMWRRINNILIEDGYVMSDYMLEGRLATQEAVPSGKFLLKDQALLLCKYLADSDRGSSKSLVKKINVDFRNEDGSYRAAIFSDDRDDSSYTNSDELVFLEAYVEYYSAYGNSEDLENIKTLIDKVFDASGNIREEGLSSTSYETETDSETVFDFEGVKISDIDLELISNLERNDLLPGGTFDRYKDIVTGALASEDIPYYAFAYTTSDAGETVYIYAGNGAASISVADSIKTMINLAAVDLLPDGVYYRFKTNLINDTILYDSYVITTGLTGGNEIQGSYCDVLTLARFKDDNDLFRTVCRIMSVRVATKKESRAIYMMFRTENGRYVFYGDENIRTYLTVNGSFAV